MDHILNVFPRNGFFLKLKWHGATNTKQSRISVSWKGWASDGSRTVRRQINHDFEKNHDDYVVWAISEFLKWLNKTSGLSKRTAATVMTTDLGNGETGIIVSTKYVHET